MTDTLRILWVNVNEFFRDPQHFKTLTRWKLREARDINGDRLSLRMAEYSITTLSLVEPITWARVLSDDDYNEEGVGIRGVALNIIDYTTPEYEKRKNEYLLEGRILQHYDLRADYKYHIRLYSKKLFDPCCRATQREKFTIYCGDETLETTFKQMVWFHWAISSGFLIWLESNGTRVRELMRADERAKREARDMGRQREASDSTFKYRPREDTLRRKKGRSMDRFRFIEMIRQPVVEGFGQ